MQTLTLGTSSLTCTRLAYGCWRLAGSEGGPRRDDAAGMAAVRAAYDAGSTLFDNAETTRAASASGVLGGGWR